MITQILQVQSTIASTSKFVVNYHNNYKGKLCISANSFFLLYLRLFWLKCKINRELIFFLLHLLKKNFSLASNWLTLCRTKQTKCFLNFSAESFPLIFFFFLMHKHICNSICIVAFNIFVWIFNFINWKRMYYLR